MTGRAYPLSYGHEVTQKVTGVVRSMTEKVRARFSRDTHSIDHWGGLNPEAKSHDLSNPDKDLEKRSRGEGSSLEELDIVVG